MLAVPMSADCAITPNLALQGSGGRKGRNRLPAEAALRSRRGCKVAMGVLVKVFTLWLVLQSCQSD